MIFVRVWGVWAFESFCCFLKANLFSIPTFLYFCHVRDQLGRFKRRGKKNEEGEERKETRRRTFVYRAARTTWSSTGTSSSSSASILKSSANSTGSWLISRQLAKKYNGLNFIRPAPFFWILCILDALQLRLAAFIIISTSFFALRELFAGIRRSKGPLNWNGQRLLKNCKRLGKRYEFHYIKARKWKVNGIGPGNYFSKLFPSSYLTHNALVNLFRSQTNGPPKQLSDSSRKSGFTSWRYGYLLNKSDKIQLQMQAQTIS